MDIEDLLRLSTTSKRMKEMIERINWDIVDISIDFTLLKGSVRIRHNTSRWPMKQCTFEVIGMNEFSDLKIRIGNIYFDGRAPTLDGNNASPERVFLSKQYHFVSICLYLFMNLFGEIRLLKVSHSYTREFETSGPTRIKYTSNMPKIFHRTFEATMRQVAVLQDTYARTCLPDGQVLKDEMMLNHTSSGCVKNAHWFKGLHLLTLSMSTAIFLKTNLTDIDIIAFIRHFMNSTNRTIKTVILYQKEERSLNDELIFGAFDTKPWDPLQRDQVYTGSPDLLVLYSEGKHLLDCADGFDIVREDGLMCTLKIWNSTCFCFYVWHQRFKDE
ncbi:hypothetical protein GCK72_025099 [Caenorhabditis remanei]|uniref:F-box domain-containing protein n=1 Tax=Caenorhabditis remanei TaxID=31234 RepID=A0A6A5G1T7_CAERE|nr:hypothetical protein GCK72_025099 [Caenorhabditis remanei]KAF1748632.1 hypothetical protein GCK72_025099 [Caenorhabditis remanei]